MKPRYHISIKAFFDPARLRWFFQWRIVNSQGSMLAVGTTSYRSRSGARTAALNVLRWTDTKGGKR